MASDPTHLTFASVNCPSATRHKPEILNYIDNLKPDILCLNETRLAPQRPFSIPGYACIRQDRNTRGGGVAILINQLLSFSIVPIPPQFIPLEAIIIQIPQKNNPPITTCAIYNPPNNPLPVAFFKYLFQNFNSLIILGDINASSTDLGGSYTNHNGNELETFIQNSNSVPFNCLDPTPYTIQEIQHSTTISLTGQ